MMERKTLERREMERKTLERREMERLTVQAIRNIADDDLMDMLHLCAHAYARTAWDNRRWILSHYWQRMAVAGMKAKHFDEAYEAWRAGYRKLADGRKAAPDRKGREP
jgi:hypothetical protein